MNYSWQPKTFNSDKVYTIAKVFNSVQPYLDIRVPQHTTKLKYEQNFEQVYALRCEETFRYKPAFDAAPSDQVCEMPLSRIAFVWFISSNQLQKVSKRPA